MNAANGMPGALHTARARALGLLAASVLLTPPATAQAAPPEDLSYQWDGRGFRSAASLDDPLQLPLGEAPLVPGTALYLSANAGLQPEVGRRVGAPAHGSQPADFGSSAAGRFGAGLRSPGGPAQLEYELSEGVRQRFSLSLWIRPEGAGQVFDLAGVASLRLDQKLRPIFVLGRGGAASPLRRRLQRPLRRGAWNLVALTLNAEEFDHAIAVTGDEVTLIRRLGLERPWRKELRLGAAPGRYSAFLGELDDVRIVRRALNTAELLALAGERPPPRDRELVLRRGAAESRYPEAWPEPLTTPRVVTPADWQRVEREHLALGADAGARWVEGQWRRDEPLLQPRARTTHPTVFVGDHTVFVFSGELRDSHIGTMHCLADTWLYDLESASWERVLTEPAPRGRVHQMAAYSPDHRVVLLHGGWINDELPSYSLNDTWLFDVPTRTWRDVSEPEDGYAGGPQRGPGTASDAPVVYDPNLRAFVLFRQNVAYRFDPATERWSRSPRATVAPDPNPTQSTAIADLAAADGGLLATSGAAGYDPVGQQHVFFGGHVGPGEPRYVDQTVHYDPASNRLRWIATDPHPSTRARSAFAYQTTQRRFVLYGGVLGQRSTRMDDLWSYDPQAERWSELEAADPPSRRGGFYSMAYDPERDEFALLCGRHDYLRFLSDAYRLRLDPNAPARLRASFDRAAFPQHRGFDVRWTKPAAVEVEVRFRTSASGFEWSDWSSEPRAGNLPAARFFQVELRASGAGADAPFTVHEFGFTEAPSAALEGRAGRSFTLAP